MRKTERHFVDFFMKTRHIFIFFLGLIIFIHTSEAQEVEHNYQVGPQMTDCDSIQLVGLTESEAIASIATYSYRFQQKFRLTRKNGFQGGEFYSCDTKHGYLIIKFNNRDRLYLDVEKSIWDELISNQDPEGFYIKIQNQLRAYP